MDIIRVASPAFIPALPPPESRIWVRLTHSQLQVWTNHSHPSDCFRDGQKPRPPVVSAGHTLTAVAVPMGSDCRTLGTCVHWGKVTFQPFWKGLFLATV